MKQSLVTPKNPQVRLQCVSLYPKISFRLLYYRKATTISF